ncbi:MAG: hypothetical protein ACLPTZ_11220 [Beijerinckiaceae bacterium]
MPTLTIDANNSHEITESLKFSLRHMRWLRPNGGGMNGNTLDAWLKALVVKSLARPSPAKHAPPEVEHHD